MQVDGSNPGWPREARCAVTFTFDFDAESAWLSRDASVANRPGILSQGRYGANVGVPRLLDLLDREGVRATFFIPGWVAEHHPDQARAIRDAGHEIAHHGYLHERARAEDPDGEREAFRRGLEALDSLGVKPLGYRSPGWDFTPITLELVRDAGMIYSSNLMDHAWPYLHRLPGGGQIVELPVQWLLDDAIFFMFNPHLVNRPIASTSLVLAQWHEELLGTHELGGLFNLTMHPQLIGMPSRLRMLRRLIGIAKDLDDTWIATCGQVAQHWLAHQHATG